MEKDISKKRTPPISVRFSDMQKTELQRRANKAGLSISGYIKFTALDQPQRKLRQPSVDRVLLAKVLGHLGRIGNNLNQIARSLNMGNSIDLLELQHQTS